MHADDSGTTPLDPDTGLPQEPSPEHTSDDPPEVPGEHDADVPVPGDGLGDELRGDALAKPDFALDEPPRNTDDARGATGGTDEG